ncbi:hypothetical protein EVAR_61190_1 [Eumeta japonica]|uniref:Uncharacterized protein n=1 Tax=Eumeta variegata TaxID=151549 RepID=A0A4C1YYJ0_EUMVA|nr:hypothetical protein EVAR_61190_1 [Eumeta japonica]
METKRLLKRNIFRATKNYSFSSPVSTLHTKARAGPPAPERVFLIKAAWPNGRDNLLADLAVPGRAATAAARGAGREGPHLKTIFPLINSIQTNR